MSFLYEQGYPPPGRDTELLKAALEPKFHIYNVEGVRNQLVRAQNWVDNLYLPGKHPTEGQELFASNDLMGRKFEAERVIWFAYHNDSLLQARSSGAGHDLKVKNFGSVKYIQVKWGRYVISSREARKTVNEFKTGPYQSGTYLIEASSLGSHERRYFISEGGEELPTNIRYPR